MPLFFTLLLLAVLPVQRPSDIVKWSAAAPASHVAAGGVANIIVTAKVQAGWKLYAIEQPPGGPVPLAFALADGAPFELVRGRIVSPKARVQKQDANFAVDTHYYEKDVTFTLPVTVPRTAAGGQTVPLEITFQACGAELCLRPFTEKINVPITVGK
jgi:thiol:disulfide interchange protein DsbD